MNLLWLAAAGQPVFNVASGGSTADYAYAGQTWRRHLFAGNGAVTLTIGANPLPFRATLIGHGGDSGYADPPTAGGTAGGGGGAWTLETVTLPVGALAIDLGTKTTPTIIPGVGQVGYGGHGTRTLYNYDRTDGGPGTWGGTSNGGNGRGSGGGAPLDPSSTFRTLRDGTVGTWGKPGAEVSGAVGGSNSGDVAMVCIEYRIA
jgi:hypothetical protein